MNKQQVLIIIITISFNVYWFANVASNHSVTIFILEVWAKWVKLLTITVTENDGSYVKRQRKEWRQRRASLVDRRPEPLICHGCDWNELSGVEPQQQVPDKRHLPAWVTLRARMIDRFAAHLLEVNLILTIIKFS